jgi:hypothetical protein
MPAGRKRGPPTTSNILRGLLERGLRPAKKHGQLPVFGGNRLPARLVTAMSHIIEQTGSRDSVLLGFDKTGLFLLSYSYDFGMCSLAVHRCDLQLGILSVLWSETHPLFLGQPLPEFDALKLSIWQSADSLCLVALGCANRAAMMSASDDDLTYCVSISPTSGAHGVSQSAAPVVQSAHFVFTVAEPYPTPALEHFCCLATPAPSEHTEAQCCCCCCAGGRPGKQAGSAAAPSDPSSGDSGGHGPGAAQPLQEERDLVDYLLILNAGDAIQLLHIGRREVVYQANVDAGAGAGAGGAGGAAAAAAGPYPPPCDACRERVRKRERARQRARAARERAVAQFVGFRTVVSIGPPSPVSHSSDAESAVDVTYHQPTAAAVDAGAAGASDANGSASGGAAGGGGDGGGSGSGGGGGGGAAAEPPAGAPQSGVGARPGRAVLSAEVLGTSR